MINIINPRNYKSNELILNLRIHIINRILKSPNIMDLILTLSFLM